MICIYYKLTGITTIYYNTNTIKYFLLSLRITTYNNLLMTSFNNYGPFNLFVENVLNLDKNILIL